MFKRQEECRTTFFDITDGCQIWEVKRERGKRKNNIFFLTCILGRIVETLINYSNNLIVCHLLTILNCCTKIENLD